MKGTCGKLCVWGFGLALGITWALGMLLMGLLATYFGYGGELVESFGSVYLGYAPTFLGSLIGALWGFVDFFIFGVIVAWLYNLFCSCACRKGDDE